MDHISVEEIQWRGVAAWQLSAAQLELVITQVGAHLAAVRSPGDELNPLWQPNWPAARPDKVAEHSDVFGTGPEASLLAAIVGHNVCIDRFGPPHPGEERPVHGEAGVMPWSLEQPDPSTISLRVRLPIAGLEVVRTIFIAGARAEYRTEVTPVDGVARDIEWAEHVTLGDPFLDGASFSAGADAAWVWNDEQRETSRFPDADSTVPVSDALAMPRASVTTPLGDIVTTRVTDGWFRAERSDLGRFLEYRWVADEFPWLCLWTQHRSRTGLPWLGGARARGMEFSTKPLPEGDVPPSRAEHFHGRPTTCTVPARGLTRTWTLTWDRL